MSAFNKSLIHYHPAYTCTDYDHHTNDHQIAIVAAKNGADSFYAPFGLADNDMKMDMPSLRSVRGGINKKAAIL